MGKGRKRQLLKEGERLKKKHQTSPKPLICVLCGEQVQKGLLLEHKEKLHGENRITRSPVTQRKSNTWVKIFSGGSPS